MAIDFEKIAPIYVEISGKTMLADLVLEYATLKQKLDNPGEQSWYFEKAVDSHKQRLKNLGKRYEKARAFFNQTSIDLMINKVNENSMRIGELEKKWMGMNTRLLHLHLVSENNRFNELIRMKSITETLQQIDYYLDNPEELLGIIG